MHLPISIKNHLSIHLINFFYELWTYNDEGYLKTSEDFKYKSRIIKQTVKDENNQSRTIEEKVVVYWSRKFQARCERENKKFLDFLKKLEESPVLSTSSTNIISFAPS